jgi:hypothetical protein
MCVLSRHKGRIAIVTTRGVGCGGREVSQCIFDAPTNGMARTAKSCGPGLPVLRPCANAFHALRKGARKPVPKEITYKR